MAVKTSARPAVFNNGRPRLLARGIQKKIVAGKIFRFVHLGTGLELAVQLESPGVIRAKEQARMTAIRFAIASFGGTVALIAEAFGHDVHGAMRANARQHADGIILGTNHDQGFTEQIQI